jgi:hypothetical protein
VGRCSKPFIEGGSAADRDKVIAVSATPPAGSVLLHFLIASMLILHAYSLQLKGIKHLYSGGRHQPSLKEP